MERDWGSAFPRAWVWTQSNHFDEDHVCLTASIAGHSTRRQDHPGIYRGVPLSGGLLPLDDVERIAAGTFPARRSACRVHGRQRHTGAGSLERGRKRHGPGVCTTDGSHGEDAGRGTECSGPGCACSNVTQVAIHCCSRVVDTTAAWRSAATCWCRPEMPRLSVDRRARLSGPRACKHSSPLLLEQRPDSTIVVATGHEQRTENGPSYIRVVVDRATYVARGPCALTD